MQGLLNLLLSIRPRTDGADGTLDFIVAAMVCVAIGVLIHWMIRWMRSIDQAAASGRRRLLGQIELHRSELLRTRELLADAQREVIGSRQTIANLQNDLAALRARCDYLESIGDQDQGDAGVRRAA